MKKAESLHARTKREQEYIAALAAFYRGKDVAFQQRADAYSAGMRKLYKDSPEDKEAGTFFALSLLASEPEDTQNMKLREEAVAVLQPIFDAEPDHPGVAHYLIHACDSPEMAKQGLPAAERYSKIAPASAHAVHMPSHIYARLGMWQEDIESNTKSVEITRQDAAMGMGGEAHQFHAMDFLMYADLQSGRDGDAMKLIEEVKAMPAMKPMYGMKSDPHLSAQARYPAYYALESRHWTEAAALMPVAGAGNSNAEVYWARGIGAARSGSPQQVQADLDQLEAMRKDAVAKDNKAEVEFMEGQQTEVRAWVDHASGRDQQAIDALTKLAQTEDADAFRNEVGGIPAREMLADMLLEMNRAQQALGEYQTELKLNPNRFNGLYGAAQAAEKSGQSQQANEYYSTLLKVTVRDSDRPELQHAKSLVASK
jgi:tetratricopeptide (TPR) repeat protein